MNSKGLYVTVLEEEMRKLLILAYGTWQCSTAQYIAVEWSITYYSTYRSQIGESVCTVQYSTVQYIVVQKNQKACRGTF
jgi:hypothetical protein